MRKKRKKNIDGGQMLQELKKKKKKKKKTFMNYRAKEHRHSNHILFDIYIESDFS